MEEKEIYNHLNKYLKNKFGERTLKICIEQGAKKAYMPIFTATQLVGAPNSLMELVKLDFYKNEDIAIVGTGNSALQEALYLANIVNHIYLINRREGFRGEDMLVEEVKNNSKIEIIYNANIKSMHEENNKLSGISLDNGTDLKVKGVFIYIGYRPATEFVPKEILDENGYVKVNDILETNIKGVYAIGDIIKKDTYQLVTAASDGARVIYNMK